MHYNTQDMTPLRITRSSWALACALLLINLPAWALYKVVGPDGQITYTDRPAPDAKAQPLKTTSGSGPATDGLPYELRQIVARYPVVLYTYTSNPCSPCDAGRQYLAKRGIPFAEKTINTTDDLRAYKNITGTDQLPMLKVGSQQLMGYSQGEWAEYLTAAGYPDQSTLPASYRPAAATPLVTPPAKERAPAPVAPTAPSNSPANKADPVPPGFQF